MRQPASAAILERPLGLTAVAAQEKAERAAAVAALRQDTNATAAATAAAAAAAADTNAQSSAVGVQAEEARRARLAQMTDATNKELSPDHVQVVIAEPAVQASSHFICHISYVEVLQRC